MAEAVIDRLEVIDVQEKDREVASVAQCPLDLFVEKIADDTAVRSFRQRVVICKDD